jgi:hypothetical protein
MKEKKQKIVEHVYNEYTGYWDVDDAIEHAPALFPFVEPKQDIRDALKALNCKKDKDERFKESRRSIETERDYHFLIRELEHMMERESMRYKKEFPEESGRLAYRDMLMMLVPVIASQKSNVSVSLDINQLNQTVYGECEKCPIRETCKEAFAIVTEYVSFALKELDFQIPKKEK